MSHAHRSDQEIAGTIIVIETGEASLSTWVTNPEGLTESEAADRRARGDDNRSSARTSRTFAQIASANIFTRFNAILGVMFGIIVVIGPIQDGLFVGVLVSNALIGIVQELRAKRTLDRLAVLNAPHACVVRGGAEHDIAVDDVVLDDLLSCFASAIRFPVTASFGLRPDSNWMSRY